MRRMLGRSAAWAKAADEAMRPAERRGESLARDMRVVVGLGVGRMFEGCEEYQQGGGWSGSIPERTNQKEWRMVFMNRRVKVIKCLARDVEYMRWKK